MDSKALAERYAGRHPSVLAALRWFDSDHLPPRLQAVAGPVAETAYALTDDLPDGPQLTIGLHKLIEAKDALVRAELDRTGERVIARDAQPISECEHCGTRRPAIDHGIDLTGAQILQCPVCTKRRVPTQPVVNAEERPEDALRRYAAAFARIVGMLQLLWPDQARTEEPDRLATEVMSRLGTVHALQMEADAEEEAKAARAEADRTVIYGDTQAGRMLQARDQARAEGIPDDPEQLAERFHNMYEQLAPHYGYQTRKASAVQWDDVPARNGALMVAVCANLLGVDLPRWVGEIQSGLAGHEPGKTEPPTVALAKETWPAAVVPAQLEREAENIEQAMRDQGFPMAVDTSETPPAGGDRGQRQLIDSHFPLMKQLHVGHPDDRDPWAADRADGEAGEQEGHAGD